MVSKTNKLHVRGGIAMTVNDVKISFDLDIRKDYNKFIKALSILKNKQESNNFGIDDMENFLKACLSEDEATQLLEDNRISTLTKSFAEFFAQGIEQFDSVSGTYINAAETVVKAQQRASELSQKMNVIGEVANASKADTINHDGI